MKKALITGISGFAGSYLTEFLLSKGYQVSGTFYDKSTFTNIAILLNKIKIFQCDIVNYESFKKIIAEVNPDEIYHLAAITFIPTSVSNPKTTFDTNLYGTLNLYNAVRELGIKPKVLFVGSSDEYGLVKRENIPINEYCPLNPTNPYSISKTSADYLSYFYFMTYHLNIIRVRPFNHIGPRQSAEFVTSDFAKQIADIEKSIKNPIVEVGNLEAQRDFTDVRDMVAAYWLALQEGKAGEVYNLCSGNGISIDNILTRFLNLSEKKIKITRDPERYRPIDIPLLVGDCRKFLKQTFWKPLIPIEETLKDILNYWRKKELN